MNSLLAELNRLGVAHDMSEDLFGFADTLFRRFSFVFQDQESDPRKVDLLSSLFEHLTIECVNEILDLCADSEAAAEGEAAGLGGPEAAGAAAAAAGSVTTGTAETTFPASQ
ncbi:protein UL91 [Aotine betaherpesvirus 1]|uniref:Protein UL91 n=1 Tax=Aotine betaherpesvirus 1 TaxID=50290 RepID=G8XUF6_9BETA|nr:protein UL91 [Aotine betaherpesvirus 1]AEV80786.1 protein UL91 [Aotine betaherpesvirus 1]